MAEPTTPMVTTPMVTTSPKVILGLELMLTIGTLVLTALKSGVIQGPSD